MVEQLLNVRNTEVLHTKLPLIMIADFGTKPLPIQRTLELKELMSMAIQKKMEEEKKEAKEDGPEAARPKKEEDQGKDPGEDKKEVKEGPKEAGRSGLQINANQMQLAVLMAIIAKARAQGGGDEGGRSPDEGPLKFLVIGYTLLVVLATLFLRRFLAWLCEPAVPSGDHAAGIPADPPAPCERSTRKRKFRAIARKLNHRRLAGKRSQQAKCEV